MIAGYDEPVAGPGEPPVLSIRPAMVTDLPDLVTIEERCFLYDRMNRRNFRYVLTRAKVTTLVAVLERRIVGYALAGHHSGTDIARIYSLAVDPDCQGRGIARTLLTRLEAAAAERGARRMRLEVRVDNRAALALYRSGGYRDFAVYRNYYEDGMSALRLEKFVGTSTPA